LKTVNPHYTVYRFSAYPTHNTLCPL